jgi:hypothetical protein
MKMIESKTFLIGNIPPYREESCWIFVKLATNIGKGLIGGDLKRQTGREGDEMRLIDNLGKRFVLGFDPYTPISIGSKEAH